MKHALLKSMLLLTVGAASAQPTFPRIDPATQAARDNDRSAILMQERDQETKALQVAEKTLTSESPGDKAERALDVERHRKNVAALDAEIQRVTSATSTVVKDAAPARLRSASRAPAALVDDASVPFWDVYRRKEVQP